MLGHPEGWSGKEILDFFMTEPQDRALLDCLLSKGCREPEVVSVNWWKSRKRVIIRRGVVA